MTDEQILRLICDHTGKRVNLPNFTLDELKEFAHAVLVAAQKERKPNFWYRDKQGMLTLIDHDPEPQYYGGGWTPLYE